MFGAFLGIVVVRARSPNTANKSLSDHNASREFRPAPKHIDSGMLLAVCYAFRYATLLRV